MCGVHVILIVNTIKKEITNNRTRFDRFFLINLGHFMLSVVNKGTFR